MAGSGTSANAALAGLRAICATDSSFEEELFLAHARRLFLRYHRARAQGEGTDIRPYLDRELRRAFDAGVSGGARIRPVSGVRSARIMDAEDEEVSGERIVVRFVALDDEADTKVLAEDWTFDRSTAMARWTGREDRSECPTCGGPRVRGQEVCEYCGIPLASGGWVVRRVEPVGIERRTTFSRQASLAIIGASAAFAVLALVLVVVLSGGEEQPEQVAASSGSTISTLASGRDDAGVAGIAELTLTSPLGGTRSADARSIGGDETCDTVARFAGFSLTARPGETAPGTITMGVALPDTKVGPGIYDGSVEPDVTVAFQRTDPDGTSVSQAWDEGGVGQASLEIATDGSMIVVFSGYVPKTSSADPVLNAELGGTVRFDCTG